jgi:hypothetical protein
VRDFLAQIATFLFLIVGVSAMSAAIASPDEWWWGFIGGACLGVYISITWRRREDS